MKANKKLIWGIGALVLIALVYFLFFHNPKKEEEQESDNQRARLTPEPDPGAKRFASSDQMGSTFEVNRQEARPVIPDHRANSEVMQLVDDAIASGYRPWESSKVKRALRGQGVLPNWTPKNPQEENKWLIEYYTNLKAKGQ